MDLIDQHVLTCPLCRAAARKGDNEMPSTNEHPEAGELCCTDPQHACVRCIDRMNGENPDSRRNAIVRLTLRRRLDDIAVGRDPELATGQRQLAADDCIPPNPYDAGIKKLRESEAARKPAPALAPAPAPKHTPREDCTPPDPYEAGLEKMRRDGR